MCSNIIYLLNNLFGLCRLIIMAVRSALYDRPKFAYVKGTILSGDKGTVSKYVGEQLGVEDAFVI